MSVIYKQTKNLEFRSFSEYILQFGGSIIRGASTDTFHCIRRAAEIIVMPAVATEMYEEPLYC